MITEWLTDDKADIPNTKIENCTQNRNSGLHIVWPPEHNITCSNIIRSLEIYSCFPELCFAYWDFAIGWFLLMEVCWVSTRLHETNFYSVKYMTDEAILRKKLIRQKTKSNDNRKEKEYTLDLSVSKGFEYIHNLMFATWLNSKINTPLKHDFISHQNERNFLFTIYEAKLIPACTFASSHYPSMKWTWHHGIPAATHPSHGTFCEAVMTDLMCIRMERESINNFRCYAHATHSTTRDVPWCIQGLCIHH
jgi:hypothetical protein